MRSTTLMAARSEQHLSGGDGDVYDTLACEFSASFCFVCITLL